MTPEDLVARPDNADVVRWVKGQATPAAPGEAMALQGFTLRTHPDLGEWIGKVAAAAHVPPPAAMQGFQVLATATGRVYGVLFGTGGFALRDLHRTHGHVDTAALAPLPELGNGWWHVAPWDADTPDPKLMQRLGYFVREAHDVAAG